MLLIILYYIETLYEHCITKKQTVNLTVYLEHTVIYFILLIITLHLVVDNGYPTHRPITENDHLGIPKLFFCIQSVQHEKYTVR